VALNRPLETCAADTILSSILQCEHERANDFDS